MMEQSYGGGSRCNHPFWLVTCTVCRHRFQHTPHSEMMDEVNVSQQAKRGAAAVLIYEMDDCLRSIGIEESVREKVYEHMNNSATQLEYTQEGDLESWNERRGHII